ncbi:MULTISPECIES: sugar ABC transporter permease [Rhizobium/Agrobacterium group]|uniref:Sugar ABC transporter permease n=2 Tax=Neorhizobium TaxID=1525371 RepID=A0ABY8M5F4_9HYPH|nr:MULTISPECIES: sugar ABC transporter permease [Rhizobium/Agrobacterium group]MCC2609480.1 sugar ABC transporter permease [Neorhizobium petrolearium]WGI69689.1 sugar ABC transporter permease [Neorhizobium petrolearium]
MSNTAGGIGAKVMRRFTYDDRTALVFIAPVMAVLGLVAVFPIGYSFYISLFQIKLTRPNRTPFVWLDNYIQLFGDDLFWTAVLRTVTFTVMSVTAITVLALLAALLLNEKFPGRRLVSTILLIPWAIPYVADALMWKWIYDSGYGALNGLLYQLGFIEKYLVWLGDQQKTLPLIANAFVWKEVPLATILLLVSLKSIPQDLYNAARVDGAPLLQRFLHVTLPSMRTGFMLVILYETMISIRHFDLFFVLTEGGPGTASHVLSWEIYIETFRNLSFGSGAAMSYVLALVTFALAYFVIKILGRSV